MFSEIGLLGVDMTQVPMWQYILVNDVNVIVAYAIGCISPATIIAKRHGIDIRKAGSGNPGTTNTLRVLGKKAALTVLLIDILKGMLAVLIAGLFIGSEEMRMAALFVFLGHVFPITQDYKGGKGVATAFGALVMIHPILGFGCLGIVALVVLITRRMSLGSIVGAIVCPFIAYFVAPGFTLHALLMAIIVIFKHKDNIKRLVKGEEPKISLSATADKSIEKGPSVKKEKKIERKDLKEKKSIKEDNSEHNEEEVTKEDRKERDNSDQKHKGNESKDKEHNHDEFDF